MNILSTGRKLLILGCITALAACDTSSSSKSSQPAPPNPEIDPNASYTLSLADTSTGAHQNIKWSVNLDIVSSTRMDSFAFDKLSMEDLKTELKNVSVYKLDTLTLRISAYKNENGNDSLIATNDPTIGQLNEDHRKIWDRDCKSIRISKFAFTPGTNETEPYTLQEDGKTIKLTAAVCDFENILVKPVVRIQPQEHYNIHQTIFACEGLIVSQYNTFSVDSIRCKVGYTPLAGTTEQENVIPENQSPVKEFILRGSLTLTDDRGTWPFTFSENISKIDLPFFARSLNLCNKYELVMNERNSGAEYRITMENRADAWQADKDFRERPELAKAEKPKFFLYCKWMSEATEAITPITINQ